LLQIGGLVDKLASIHARRHISGWAQCNPIDAHFLELRTSWIRYRTAGIGAETVVMFTDAPLTISDYDRLMALLGKRFKVYVLEAPACGRIGR
jgi:hypothetical protein